MVQQATKVAAVGWVEELGETHKKLNKRVLISTLLQM